MPRHRQSMRAPAFGPAPIFLAVVLLVGCATAGTLKKARGTGEVREYTAPWKEMWQAALKSIPGNGLQLDRANEYERWIMATHYVKSAGSGLREDEVTLESDQGERIGIFLDSIGVNKWAVEVVTVKRFALDPAKLEWADDIFWVIERELNPEGRIRIPDRAFKKPPGH